MVATLRTEVIPHVEGDYARGQAYGVIYMLNSLKLRASWSNGFLMEQVRALEDVWRALHTVALDLPGAPIPAMQAPPALLDAAAMEAARNEGDKNLCDLIDWLATNRRALSLEALRRAEEIIDGYIERQSKFELSTSAKPMFVEMSGGSEKT
jgi:hypothetical protein